MSRDIYRRKDICRDSLRGFVQKEVRPYADRRHEQGIVDREVFQLRGDARGHRALGRPRSAPQER